MVNDIKNWLKQCCLVIVSITGTCIWLIDYSIFLLDFILFYLYFYQEYTPAISLSSRSDGNAV